MKKQQNKKQDANKTNDELEFRIICPICEKDKKSLTLNDGYTICAYCGTILYKPKHSLELIDAPGFKIIEPKQEKEKIYKKRKDKHHNLIVMNHFINQFKIN